jgi:sugar phosphate isomerase/epimerase
MNPARFLHIAGLLALTLLRGASAQESAKPAEWEFFPFCIDWHDERKRSLPEQAQMLKELGYPGVGHIFTDKVEERIATLDAAGLRLFQITITVEVGPGKKPYDDARMREVFQAVTGRRVQFCVTVNGMKPSDESVDPHAVEVLRGLSDLAGDSGAQLLLYPHLRSWVERIEDACRVADKVNRPNLGVMFNLCHWLRVDANRDPAPLLRKALPRLWAVSINGADAFDPQPGWSRYIQPLDKGDYDLAGFLRTLRDIGYRGPVGLQCYGIGGDAREHLALSLARWKELREHALPDRNGQ